MKRLSVLVFSSVIFLVSASGIYAQTATAPSVLKQQLRDQFKARLQVIKDATKQALVERLSVNFDTINKKHTARFSEVLTKLQMFVDKFSLTATDPKILLDIKTAQAAIDSAKTAVTAQAEKEYIIQITTETKLRLNTQTTVSQLRKDLMRTHRLVVNAKQATQKLRTDKVIRTDATGSANL